MPKPESHFHPKCQYRIFMTWEEAVCFPFTYAPILTNSIESWINSHSKKWNIGVLKLAAASDWWNSNPEFLTLRWASALSSPTPHLNKIGKCLSPELVVFLIGVTASDWYLTAITWSYVMNPIREWNYDQILFWLIRLMKIRVSEFLSMWGSKWMCMFSC